MSSSKQDEISQAEREEFLAIKGSRVFKRLENYLEARAQDALNTSVIRAREGKALETVAAVRQYEAFSTIYDDFSNQYI